MKNKGGIVSYGTMLLTWLGCRRDIVILAHDMVGKEEGHGWEGGGTSLGRRRNMVGKEEGHSWEGGGT